MRNAGSDELVAEVTEMFLVDYPAGLAQIKAAARHSNGCLWMARSTSSQPMPHMHALKRRACGLSPCVALV
jgi:hypothetical protein